MLYDGKSGEISISKKYAIRIVDRGNSVWTWILTAISGSCLPENSSVLKYSRPFTAGRIF